MKKTILFLAVIFFIGSCSQEKKLKDNLTGTWYIYKLLVNGIEKTNVSPFVDTLRNYTIEFTEGGDFIERNVFPPDSVSNAGKWAFEDNNEKLSLTDSANGKRVFTIFNLEGNHVELRASGRNRYLRKKI
jgi:hypothetical protein